jgi:hypothetical protein
MAAVVSKLANQHINLFIIPVRQLKIVPQTEQCHGEIRQ